MKKDGGNEASPLSGLGQGDRQVGQGRQRLPCMSFGAKTEEVEIGQNLWACELF